MVENNGGVPSSVIMVWSTTIWRRNWWWWWMVGEFGRVVSQWPYSNWIWFFSINPELAERVRLCLSLCPLSTHVFILNEQTSQTAWYDHLISRASLFALSFAPIFTSTWLFWHHCSVFDLDFILLSLLMYGYAWCFCVITITSLNWKQKKVIE